MTSRSISTLKGYFNTSDTPTEGQFAELIDSIHGFKTMADLEASVDTFAEGEIILVEDYRFRVAAAGASDHDLTLPSGVKLYDSPIIAYVGVAPPVAVGSIDEQIFTEDTGSQVVNAGPYFSGWVTTWEVTGSAAVSINNSGLITVDTANAVAAVQIVVTASNDGGSDSQTFNLTIQAAEATPVITSAGTATGTGEVGSRVYVPNATFTGTGVTHSFQWTLDGVDIPGATQHNYVPKQADIGGVLARRYTVTNGVGSDTETSTTIPVIVYEKSVEFDPLYKSSGLTIVNGTQAHTDTDANLQVKTDRWFGVNAPKFYFEYKIPSGTTVSNFTLVGVAQFWTSLAHSPATNVATSEYTFAKLNGGVGAPTGFGDGALGTDYWDRANGDSVRVCVDRSVGSTGTIWFGNKNGWNGDPSAGTGGFPLPDYERLVVQIAPRTGTGANGTLRTKAADLEYAIPTGAIPMAQLESTYEASTAAKADDLVEMLGINIHINRQSAEWGTTETWKTYISDIGFRYVRSLIGSATAAIDDLIDIIDNHGVEGVLVRLAANNGGDGVYNLPQITTYFDAITANIAATNVIGFEGPNEPNITGTNANWAANSHAAQQETFNVVNANGTFASKPVISVAFWQRSSAAQTAFQAVGASMATMSDKTNLHYYTDGSRPTYGNTLEKSWMHMNRVISQVKSITGSTGLWVTEYGHRTYNGATSPDNFTPSPDVAAAYGLRGVFEFFRRGAEKVFWYSLVDDYDTSQDPYGLVRRDAGDPTHTKRPAYFAFKRLIALFDDAGSFTPTDLRYNLTGNLSNIKHNFFQKSNGKYLLVVYNDEQTWDKTGRVETSIPDRTIKLGLAKRATSIIEHKPTFTATTATIATNAFEATLAVPDEVAVYEITIG